MMYFLWNTLLFILLLGIGGDVEYSQIYGDQPAGIVGFEIIVAYVLWLRMRGELRRLRLLNKAVEPMPSSPLEGPQLGPVTSG